MRKEVTFISSFDGDDLLVKMLLPGFLLAVDMRAHYTVIADYYVLSHRLL
jgi:hypothetical protein